MIVIAGKIIIKSEKRDEAIEAAVKMARTTQQEAGCISYNFFADLTDHTLFHVFEEWETEEALSKHFQTEHMKEFRQVLPSLLAGKTEIKRYTVQSVTPL